MKRLILNQEELSELEVLQVLGGAFCQYGRRDILTYQIVEEFQSPVLRISTHLHGTCPRNYLSGQTACKYSSEDVGFEHSLLGYLKQQF